jgi:hypothetical protein
MELLLGLSLLSNFAVGAVIVAIRACPKTQMKLSAWLEARAIAQEEIRVATVAIQSERFLHQANREKQLLAKLHPPQRGRDVVEIRNA